MAFECIGENGKMYKKNYIPIKKGGYKNSIRMVTKLLKLYPTK